MYRPACTAVDLGFVPQVELDSYELWDWIWLIIDEERARAIEGESAIWPIKYNDVVRAINLRLKEK